MSLFCGFQVPLGSSFVVLALAVLAIVVILGCTVTSLSILLLTGCNNLASGSCLYRHFNNLCSALGAEFAVTLNVAIGAHLHNLLYHLYGLCTTFGTKIAIYFYVAFGAYSLRLLNKPCSALGAELTVEFFFTVWAIHGI